LFVVALFLRQVMRHQQVNILQQKARQHAQLESERWKMRDSSTYGCGFNLSYSGDGLFPQQQTRIETWLEKGGFKSIRRDKKMNCLCELRGLYRRNTGSYVFIRERTR
jgi:hypothetical protein